MSMEVPTYGGVRKLQDYCSSQGFPLPEFFTLRTPDTDLDSPTLDLMETVMTGHLYNSVSGNSISFDSKLVENPSAVIRSNPEEPGGMYTQMSFLVTMRASATISSEGAAFLCWFGEHQRSIESIARWGLDDPSWRKIMLFICRPRTYAKRVFSI